MSLINDALKRASGKPAAPADLPTAAPIMQAADAQKGTPRAWMLAGAAILVIGTTVIFLRPKTEPVQASAPAPAAAETKVAAAAAVTETKASVQGANPVQRAAAILEKVAAQNAEGERIADTVARPVAVVPAAAQRTGTLESRSAANSESPVIAAKPPESKKGGLEDVRLQAIFYRMTGPTAVLNGKTLRLGQEVDGVKLIAIQRTAVEVEFAGTRKKLSLN